MCIAILNAGAKVSFEDFKTSLENNPDGFGMAWIEDKTIKVFRSLSLNAKTLYKKYSAIYDKTSQPIMLHFRIGTSGLNDLSNCHPFYINKELIFCHNGVIQGMGTVKKSDTREFNDIYLKHIRKDDLLHNHAIKDLIEQRIKGSKFILLDNLGNYVIYNEGLGHWSNDNNWYSNYSYIPYDDSYYYGSPKKPTKVKKKVSSDLIKCEGCLDMVDSVKFNPDYNIDLCEGCCGWLDEDLSVDKEGGLNWDY
jgi:predicted glutamine amidotransferase